MRRLLLLLVPLVLVLAGCAQTDSSSVVRADGSVERKVSVTVDNTSNPTATEESGVMPSALIRFHSEAGWKVEEKKGDKGQDIITGARTIKPGEALQEEFRISDNNEGVAACVAKAEKTADGQIVYTETWTWVGKINDSNQFMSKLQEVIDTKLAPWGLSDPERKSMAEAVRRKANRALFGPGDPLLGLLLTSPNQGVRKLNNVVAGAFLEQLESVSSKTRAEKIAVVKEMVAGLDAQNIGAPEPPTAEPGSSKPDMMVSVLSRVKGPGQIVEHNGELDVLEDEVFWSMYLEASMVEPVVLRAVFRP